MCFVRAATLLCEQQTPRPCVYFVTSDSSAAKRNFTAALELRDGTVLSGERDAVHIDHMSIEGDAASLIDRASPDYMDWYMLTQVCAETKHTLGISTHAATHNAMVRMPAGAIPPDEGKTPLAEAICVNPCQRNDASLL